jgi:hypothetical protein
MGPEEDKETPWKHKNFALLQAEAIYGLLVSLPFFLSFFSTFVSKDIKLRC